MGPGADSGRACPEDCPSLLQCGADSGRPRGCQRPKNRLKRRSNGHRSPVHSGSLQMLARYTCVRKEMCGRLLPRGFAVHEDQSMPMPPMPSEAFHSKFRCSRVQDGTGRCASCDIPGCDKCADVAQCARCGSGFEELSGKCILADSADIALC